MSSSGSTKAILAALTANGGIAVAKFTGYVITGSAAMLAEAVHSVVDTSNQALLLFGQRAAAKAPDALHPFGHGRSRYFWSFVVALVLFSLGSMFALYEGYEKVRHPVELSSPLVAIAILLVAIGLRPTVFAPQYASRARSRARAAGGGSCAPLAIRSCRWCCSRTPRR